jgi:carbamoyltransferase
LYVLGISAFYHDSAAALLKDGCIVAAAQEERFSRTKHDPRFPGLAVSYCLDEAGIGLEELDYVGFYDKPLLTFDRLLETYFAFSPRGIRSFAQAIPIWVKEKLLQKRHLIDSLNALDRGECSEDKLHFGLHHHSHAASAFYPSPFTSAAVLVIDGVGEWATTTIGHARDGRIELLKELRFPHSLGLLYSAFTAYCGFEVNEGEYKLMGMHPYGKPTMVDKIYELIDVAEDGSLWHDMKYFSYHYSRNTTLTKAFEDHFGKPARDPKTSDKSLDPFYCDMAASIQRVTEEVVMKMVTHLHKTTGMKNLCMAGGVALNSVNNYKILRDGPFDDLFIHPAPGDDGGAVGAAYWAYNHLLDQPRGPAIQDAYYGSENSDDEVRAFLEKHKIPYKLIEDDEVYFVFVARALVDGLVCGWFRGRFEWGPRALG